MRERTFLREMKIGCFFSIHLIFIRRVKEYREVKEVPRRQRYIGRLELAGLLKGAEGKKEISRKSREAVERYGCSQKEIADYFGIHYSTVSSMINKGI